MQDVRPFDNLGRPAANPIDYSQQPNIEPQAHGRPQQQAPPIRRYFGRRDDVLCYNPADDSHTQLRNVLLRDFSRNNRTRDETRQLAYYPSPYKVPIRTIMGHVEICHVLERCQNTDDEDGDCSDDDFDPDDDEIVFQWTERKVAVKVYSHETMLKLRGRHAEDPLKEIATMQFIGNNHENVLGCLEVLHDRSYLNVVMEYCDSGDLFQLLQDTQKMSAGTGIPGLTEEQAKYWFRQIVEGVGFLHEQCGICHRDLSPENVMIDQHRRAVVIDMGMALRMPYQIMRIQQQPQQNVAVLHVTDMRSADAFIQRQQHQQQDGVFFHRRRCLMQPQGTCGKFPYMSPEVYRNLDAFDGEAIDMWSLGTILFCMITGNRSYRIPDRTDAQFYWMTVGLEQLLRDWGIALSEPGIHLLKNLLQVDPRLRLTLQEVRTHPWLVTDINAFIPNNDSQPDHVEQELLHQLNRNTLNEMEFNLDSDDDDDDEEEEDE